MSESGASIQKLDQLTLVGLALLLSPLLTMWHELAGHGGACLLSGGHLKEIGASYIDCDSASMAKARFVMLAGAGIDVVIGLAAFLLWRVTKKPLLRTALWSIMIYKLLLAAGYPLFSGVMNVGDLSVGTAHSLGDLSPIWAWRLGFILLGLGAYVGVVVLGIRTMRAMLGGGAARAQRQIALTLYAVNGAVTLLAAIPNPVGAFIVFTSGAAAFGGLAGMFNIAFSGGGGEARPFVVARNWPVIVAGMAATAFFMLILGPSIRFT